MAKTNDDVQLLASEYIVTDKNGMLTKQSQLANNLYNASLYQMRQYFFKHRKLLSYNALDSMFKLKVKQRENMLYHSFTHVHIAQQTLKEVSTICHAWLKALKAYRVKPQDFSGRPRIPRYLRKQSKHTFFATNQTAKVKDGYLVIQKLGFKLKLADNLGKIKQVVFKPLSKKRFKVIVQYEHSDVVALKQDNGIYVSIDAGLDNAFTCVTNNARVAPLIINGKGVKSVNQNYNRHRSRLQALHAQYHQCCKDIQTKQGLKTIYFDSQAMLSITDWRNNKVKQFAHKATKRIIDYTLNCGANTIVIGNNRGWKRSINLGKRNNQNFIGIPHKVMVDMLEYKARLVGLNVVKTNESYTSQTSFLDNEKPCKENGNVSRKQQGLSPAKRRIKRGLFKANNGTLINADVNGALQIFKKVCSNFRRNDELADVVLRPVKCNLVF